MNKSVFALAVLCLVVAVLSADESSPAAPPDARNRGVSRSGIPLEPNAAQFVVVEKVPVVDCRVVRGFLGTPVDGSIYSWDYRGRTREYPNTASDGVVYSYKDNDGLHITLGDEKGFDLLMLRGGARTKLYSDVYGLDEPVGQGPLCEFEGIRQEAVVRFNERVRTEQVSFFDTSDGTISDVGFYRIEHSTQNTLEVESWTSVDGSVEPVKPQSLFAPESIHLALSERYGKRRHRCVPLLLAEGGGSSPVVCRAHQATHFMTPRFRREKGLTAVALEMSVSGPAGPFSFTVMVQDPLDPRLDLVWLDFRAAGTGEFRIKLDIPDQVLQRGNRLWLTLRFDSDVILTGSGGDGPKFQLFFISREEALSEALARRKMLMKTFFSLLSEPRPWGSYTNMSREQFYASSAYAGQCPELFMTIDQCHALDPTDDTVRQYREWVYLRNLDKLSYVTPPPGPPEAVPAWAWYPRLAWLEVRRIANWWIEERLVPTGEFGGRVGDDSDFYQQFTDMPFFETGGVAGQLMDSAARMAELADKENLRDGLNIHTTDSLHAYEEGINHLALMARWFYGDPIYLERCMESARNMEKLTILTEDGRRHFRDRDRMGAEGIEQPLRPNIDGHANPLMWHTALQVADYNRNTRALNILCEWADTWLGYMEPGRWATDVEVLSGKVVEFQENRPLYGGYRSQATTFTWLYALTGDERYIGPFLHYYRQGRANYPANGFLGDVYTLGGLDGLDPQTLTSLADYNPALALYVRDDRVAMVEAAIGRERGSSQQIATLYDARRWPDMYTTTHQFTDRIFPSLLGHASIAYLGGFCRRNKFNPTLAFSWEGFGTDYTALVLDNQPGHAKILIYSFANEPLKGNMRIWALEHGIYQLTTGTDADGDQLMDAVERAEFLELAKADRIELTLAPKAVTVIEIEQADRLARIFDRADLAIAAREVRIEANTLTAIAHNIGSADVYDVVVAVVDAMGREVVRKSLGGLGAPVDLVPRRIPFTLQLPAELRQGCKLVLDPGQQIPEIYEGNNVVDIDRLPVVDYSREWN